MHLSGVLIGPPLFTPVLSKAVRAGFPSPADDYLDAPIDMSRSLFSKPPATFIIIIITTAGDSAIGVGIFDGSLIG